MAYSEKLADRIRAELEPLEFGEIKMFGGLCFTIGGNMAVGVMGDDLLVRVPPEDTPALLKKPGAKPFQMMRGPAPKGFLMVEPSGTKTAKALGDWVRRGADLASSLPPKRPKKR